MLSKTKAVNFNTTKNRVIIIHRWSGGPNDDWRPWLKKELEAQGCEVIVPDMPDTEVPVIEKWVKAITEAVGILDERTFFAGHSIGCQAILRYLESVANGKFPAGTAGGAVFVAGWFNLENLEDAEVAAIAKPWIETPLSAVQIKKVLPCSTLIISDNDPYGCFEENHRRFGEFITKEVVVPGAGHFTGVDGFRELPAVLEELGDLVQRD